MSSIRVQLICVSDSESENSEEKKNKMKIFSVALATLTLGASLMLAAQDPMVGGAKMYANKDIVDNALNSADHTTLVAAVKAAGLVTR